MESLQSLWRKTKFAVSDSISSQFRRLESTSPDHIGVAGNPPLCRNCTRCLCTFEDLDENTVLALSFARLKVSAELGCYLCCLLYNAEWSPLDVNRQNLPPGEKLSELSQPPEIYMCSVDQSEEEEDSKRFHIRATAGTIDMTGQLWQLHLVLLPEEEVEARIPRKLSAANTADSIAHLATSWIQECETTHSGCMHTSATPGWKPSRLIYVGRPDKGINPRLCLSSAIPVDKAYTTLSHCWGLVKIFTLISTNIEDIMMELPLSQLSNVFQDAIDLTRRIGIDYIWIGSLCIMQDSVEDWEHESEVMGNVYKHSWCNIAATGFENGLKSFYVQRDPKILEPQKLSLQIRRPNSQSVSKLSTGSYYSLENIWDANITKAPLNQRAWVCQERLLSPRVLHMGSNQVFWECAELEACESFPNGIPDSIQSNYKAIVSTITSTPISSSESASDSDVDSIIDDNDHEIEEEQQLELLELWWDTVVKNYNQGKLTKYEDKLIAISGVAKEVQRHLKDEYIAGLWGRRLLLQLAWFVPGQLTDNSVTSFGSRPRPQEYQAPSWSWAAINGPVESYTSFDAEPLAEILDYKVIPASHSEYGRIRDGYIRIRGQLTQATFDKDDKYLRDHWEDILELRLKGISSVSTLACPLLVPDVRIGAFGPDNGTPSFPVRDAIGSREFWLLPICENDAAWVGLILVPSGSGIRGEYRRIGAFSQLKKEEKWFNALQSHIPSLDSEDYERCDDRGYTISIV